MMGWKNMIRKLLFLVMLTLTLGLIQSNTFALTASIPVELTVPDTLLRVEGFAAPNALVTIRETGNTVASVIADNTGNFQTLISRPPGIHKISLDYIDSNSTKSQTNTQTISLQPQQTYNYDVFLSPTLARGNPGSIVNGSIVQFRGFTIPDALVTLRIDYNSYKFEAVSDANGFYEFLIESSLLGDGNHVANTSVTSGVSLSDKSRSINFNVEPKSDPSSPDIIVKPQQLSPPITSSPQDGAVIDGNEVTIYGESVPNAQINIYENNIVIGSVFSDDFGKWFFKYSANSSPVTLSFEACIDGICSVLSRTLTLNFSNLNTKCSVYFGLENYRYWGVAVNEQINIKPIDIVKNGVFEINWGDSVVEKFSYNQLKNNDFIYNYSSKGNFNGSITFESIASDNCKQTLYFSVLVSEDNNNENYYNLLWLLLLIIGLLTLNYLVSKDKENYTVQKYKNKL
jgi:hypothetical protein